MEVHLENVLLYASYASFILFGALSLLNLYLGKWGAAIGMCGMMAIALVSGVLQGVDILWSAFVAIVTVAIVAFYVAAARKTQQK
ncbi:hypothetical protein [Noviherbaspirillum malthae]|uniref:hypothetical protein n=1 Tax=Noviherbaspirillum malthae TaxID=1260987 RepID=UPI001890188F|nr:hypothetical protein [Noviherbaspirillum malthae]